MVRFVVEDSIMPVYVVDVWDKRDYDKPEPGSLLGSFDTLEQARKERDKYRAEHIDYIGCATISVNDGKDFWELYKIGHTGLLHLTHIPDP